MISQLSARTPPARRRRTRCSSASWPRTRSGSEFNRTPSRDGRTNGWRWRTSTSATWNAICLMVSSWWVSSRCSRKSGCRNTTSGPPFVLRSWRTCPSLLSFWRTKASGLLISVSSPMCIVDPIHRRIDSSCLCRKNPIDWIVQ